MDGIHLTKEEYNYLDLTSEELNKMIDKRYYQRKANLLDREFIHNVEICIADEILSNYLKARNKVEKNRKKFLSLRSKKKAVENERFFKRMYETELSLAQKHKKKRVYDLMKKIIGQILESPEKMKKLQKKIQKVGTMFKEMKRDTQKLKTMYGLLTPNQLEHYRHPHSKVMKKMNMKERRAKSSYIESRRTKKIRERRNSLIIKIQNEEKKFRVKRNTISKITDQNQFMKCYSGGPLFQKNNNVINHSLIYL